MSRQVLSFDFIEQIVIIVKYI